MTEPAHRPRALAALVLLGFANAAWAGFLWSELLVARSGGTPFCAADGHTGCVSLWDSALASFVHAWTGLPVAGWGVLWSILAFGLPLFSLARGPADPPGAAVRAAILLTSGAGVLTVLALAVTSFVERALCTGCLGTYALVTAFALTAFWTRDRSSKPSWKGGARLAGAGGIAAFLALLYPGLATPRSAEELTRGALASGATALSKAEVTPLSEMLSSLPPAVQETLAGLLLEFSVAPALDEPPRALLGDPRAPVVLTEFSDALCGHCARLHGVLRELEHKLPAGSFALESRQFPLDPACNPNVPGTRRPEDESVRCLAAKVRICLEGTEESREFGERMFADQLSLSPERLLELARPYIDPEALRTCIHSEETAQKLARDIAYAMRHDIQGTPLVLINGRKGSAFPPFLLAVIGAGADLNHPAFRLLPKPRRPE